MPPKKKTKKRIRPCETKLAKVKLLEDRTRFCYNFLDNTNDLAQSVGLDGRFVYVNRQWQKVLGYTQEEAKRLRFEQVLRRDQIAVCRKTFKALCRGKTFREMETFFKARDGKEIAVEGNLGNIKEGGRVVATTGIFREVGQRRQMERKLRQSERRLRSLFASATELIFILDCVGHIREINSAVVHRLGYTRDELIGKPLGRVLTMGSRNLFKKRLPLLLNQGTDRHELDIRGRFGNVQRVDSSGSVIRSQDGKALGVVLFQRDITAQHQMEEALQESEEKFRSIFENADDLITYVDKSGKVLDVNDRVVDILGYQREEIIGRNFTRLGILPTKDLLRLAKILRADLRRGKAQRRITLNLKDKQGQVVPMEVATRFVKKDGKIGGIVNIFRKRQEAENLTR